MLRYKTKTRPGLVALYDIRPGNGAGLFLQPRSPHRAFVLKVNSDTTSQNFSLFLLNWDFKDDKTPAVT